MHVMGIPEVKRRSDLCLYLCNVIDHKAEFLQRSKNLHDQSFNHRLVKLKGRFELLNNTLGLAADAAGPSTRIPFTDSGMSQKCEG
jgi:hypothetical protein